MALLNLGIVAHVDAGKTSLTERLLFEAGAIAQPGSVNAGTTRTDSMELERRRGITIRAAVTSISLGDLTVNLLDTPGHPDFIAEVERSLAVLDAAVLVVSSVEGVQPQTVVIWRALRRIGVPTVLFLNKVDRAGADVDRALAQVRQRLTAHPVVLTTVAGEGGRDARVRAVELDADPVVEAVANVDDVVLARWSANKPVRRPHVRRAVRDAVRRNALTPVACGSAVTGAGVPELRRILAGVLPRYDDPGGPLAGTVFAVDRDGHGRRTWIRLWSGRLQVRDRVRFDAAHPERATAAGPETVTAARPGKAAAAHPETVTAGAPETVTQIAVSEPAGVLVRPAVFAGQIAAVRGLSARIGQHVGDPPRRQAYHFPPATRQALVEPVDPGQRLALFAGLSELADEDPLVDLRLDEHQEQAVIRLHGEVQKEVVAALLADRYGVQVRFSGTLTACIERVTGAAAAEDRISERGNPYLAGVGLRIEAAPVGQGVRFHPGVEPGRLPPAFIAATEQGVRAALRQGRHGWPVTDCTVTMTSSQYAPRQSRPHQKFDKSISSVAADFRNLAPVVITAALRRAGTRVCQPVERFELDVPQHTRDRVTALLGRVGAVVHDTSLAGGYTELSGTLPSSRVPQVTAALPDLTGGEAVLTTGFDHYAPVTGEQPPALHRRGPDPADREVWFRAVPR